MKKSLPYILYSVVILGAGGMLVWQYLQTGEIEFRGLLIIAAAIVGMLRPRRKKVANKKLVYQKAYVRYIQDVFTDQPKLERLFYNAVDDFNNDRYSAAITKLNKLRGECTRISERYAVTVFLALSYDNMGAMNEAIVHYADAARYRNDSTLLSNMGMCCLTLGRYAEAEQAYTQAISADPSNPFPRNNMAALHFRQGNFETALDYARQAIELDPKMPQALSCAAICSALMDDQAGYEEYYRRAVVNGYDGQKIKNAIQSLRTDL